MMKTGGCLRRRMTIPATRPRKLDANATLRCPASIKERGGGARNAAFDGIPSKRVRPSSSWSGVEDSCCGVTASLARAGALARRTHGRAALSKLVLRVPAVASAIRVSLLVFAELAG